ncbi:MAG: hypothetical protein R6X35_00615 [Candidatus Krumholzibacteriia bacterium]
MATLVFQCGLSLGPGRCAVLAQMGDDDSDRPRESLVLTWAQGSDPIATPLGWIATRLATAGGPDEIAVMGPEGDFGIIAAAGLRHEPLQPAGPGPDTMGHLRDLQAIGGRYLAAGMGRQVYLRAAPGRWERLDDGALADPAALEVTGFNAVDGVDLDHLNGVGFGGEIWYRDGEAWRRVDSPTNLVLYGIAAVSPDLVFAGGQAGVLLRGSRDRWVTLPQPLSTGDIWDLAWFRDRLYVATTAAVFVLDGNDELQPLDIGAGGPGAAQALHAAHGALWSFGASHLAWTEDGETWQSVRAES